MPKTRLPHSIWNENIRPIIWKRDKKCCVICKKQISLEKCHIDHIVAGKFGTNKISNLRTLCFPCHALRTCYLHRGLTSIAVEKGIIPPKWRHLTWGDETI